MNDFSFESCLSKQLEIHRILQPQDIVKLCYQAAFGAEHLLNDVDSARAYFMQEFENTPPEPGPIYEDISEEFVRVNIGPWKAQGLPAKWLFELFRASTVQLERGRERMLSNLETADKMLSLTSISQESWDAYLLEYKKQGMPSVHHSEEYRQAEKPAYRLVSRSLLRLLPALNKLKTRQGSPCVIAIDGRAGSGKTTVANALGALLDADIVRMDDFFLPLELRSPERLSAPGGNVHYERFKAEVLPKLHSGEDFSYQVFSCSEMKITGSRKVKASDYIIVEGSYSLHPEFGDYADIKLFSHVEPDEQLRRIKLRDGEDMAEVFAAHWIPMEEKYFREFQIPEKCSIII